MAAKTMKQGVPPEKVDVATGKRTGNGPVGFSAAMLPFLQKPVKPQALLDAIACLMGMPP